MTPLALLQPSTARPQRLFLQQAHRAAQQSLRPGLRRAAARHRPRATSGSGGEPGRAPEEAELLPPQAQQLAEQHGGQQQLPAAQPREEARRGERWQPACLLSGWKGPATLMLSLSAVSGGGLLGECCPAPPACPLCCCMPALPQLRWSPAAPLPPPLHLPCFAALRRLRL